MDFSRQSSGGEYRYGPGFDLLRLVRTPGALDEVVVALAAATGPLAAGMAVFRQPVEAASGAAVSRPGMLRVGPVALPPAGLIARQTRLYTYTNIY